jgi:hypothetical protein
VGDDDAFGVVVEVAEGRLDVAEIAERLNVAASPRGKG